MSKEKDLISEAKSTWVDPIELKIEKAKNNIFAIVNNALNELNVPINVIEMILNDALAQVKVEKKKLLDGIANAYAEYEKANAESVENSIGESDIGEETNV